MYVVTDKNLYQQVDAKAGGFGTGRDSGFVPLHNINSIGTDMPGLAFGQNCCPITQLTLGVPPGSAIANSGGGNHDGIVIPHRQCVMLVDEPEEAMKLIREAKANAESVPAPVQLVMPTILGQAANNPRASGFTKIQQLKQLLDAGAITQEEFDEKKRETLNDM